MQTLYGRCDELKARIDKYRPFPKETLASMRDYYRIGLTYASNALEGNSLTISEVKVVIEDGLTINGKPLREMYETIGHAKAYEYLYQIAGKNPLTLDHILMLHRLFYQNIDSAHAGVFRKKAVFISGSSYPVCSPKDLSSRMKTFVAWFNKTEGTIHPVEFAALVHQKFVFIHPFIDGNGRVSRLLMNLALLRSGFTIAVISPVLRQEYNACLERAHENPEDFCLFIARSVIETEKELLRLIEGSVSEFPGIEYTVSKDISGDGISGATPGAEDRINDGGDRLSDRINKAGDRINDRLQQIYSIITEHPGINANGISELCNKSIATINRDIAKLKGAGKIEFRGAKKNGGYYSVIE
ncbi:MAG TPA: Fic family protein [Methanocorpusculum sp.]|nr:Fic family protein [Methanocorpusculum sp.]